jgi:macrolide transport system ATP-binding/permease protein
VDSIFSFFRKLGILLRREKFSSGLEEEMAFHREQREKELRAEGMSAESAHYGAIQEFGNELQLKEQSREIVGFWFETVLQDFRFALRQLRKNPGFTGTAICVFAFGVCASVAIFAFVDAALIKPLPYANPNRLVGVTESVPMIPRARLSYLDYLDWKKLNNVYSSLDVWDGDSYLLTTPAGPQTAPGARVSDGFFRTLGIAPMLGRDFYAGEDSPSAPRTVMLTYAAWQKRFGQDQM